MSNNCLSGLLELTVNGCGFFGVFTTVIIILLVALTFAINCVLLYHFNSIKVTKKFKWLVLIAFLLGTLATIVRFGFMILTIWDIKTVISLQTVTTDTKALFYQTCDWNKHSMADFINTLTIMSNISSFGGYLFIYITYWRRCILLFKGSVLAVSNGKKLILIVFAVLLILINILSLFLSFVAIKHYNINNTSEDGLLQMIGINAALFCLIYIIASIFLSYLVFSKMKNLMQTCIDINNNSINIEHGYITTKLTVLVLISTITTCLTLFATAVTGATGAEATVWLFALVIQSLDTLTNNICLYLQFDFATKYYTKCCKLCHNWFQKRYMFLGPFLESDNIKNKQSYIVTKELRTGSVSSVAMVMQ